MMNVPFQAKNAIVTFDNNCLLPIFCVQKDQDPLLRLLSDDEFLLECDQSNLDLHGFAHKGSTYSNITYDLREPAAKSLKYSVLKKQMNSKNYYSALFFCPLYKDYTEKTLAFEFEFLTRFSLDSRSHKKTENLRDTHHITGVESLTVDDRKGLLFKIEDNLTNFFLDVKRQFNHRHILQLEYLKDE